MIKAPLPENEKERLEALRRYNVLDTPPEEALDDLTALAAAICGTPIALVSLVDEHRQWFKSKVGIDISETPRDVAFCAHGILRKDVMIVPDAQKDERFKDNPLVTGDPHLRFYAGVPLITSDGAALGMLCVNDREPRTLTSEQTTALRTLGRQAVTHLELRRYAAELAEAQSQLKQFNQELEKRVQERTSAIVSVNTVLTQEIEERRRAETSLKESRDRFEIVSQATNDVIWDLDMETKRTTVNEHLAAHFGHPGIGPVIEMRWWMDHLHPEDRGRVRQSFFSAAEGGHVWSEEYRFQRGDGTYAAILDRGIAIRDAQNRPQRMIGVMVDITERKKLETAMIQSEKMAGIGQFAAGVAHDINNPIAVILGFSQSLIPRYAEGDPLMMPLKAMEREALRCKALVQTLLAFSRNQKSEVTITLQDLPKVTDEALALVVTLARSKKVELKRIFEKDLPPIPMDSQQIQQVIINLCTNAIDAMPSGGTITLGLAKQEDAVVISVTDTGTGIPPEVRERMFEAFFTTKEVGKGTGLGLSLISDIVKKHQGKINVQSDMGRGTTFTISLPITQLAQKARGH
jgi:PAS domain S-box-containing protein